jgi:DNA polymerase III subunit gamma/tau
VTVLFDRWARAVDEASRLPTPRLLYEMAAIDLCAAEPMVPLGDLLQRLDDLEGRLRAPGARGGGSAPAPSAPPIAKSATAKPPAGPRAWGAPASPSPGPSAPAATASAATSPAASVAVAGPAPVAAANPVGSASPASSAAPQKPAGSPAEIWRTILTNFEAKRPRLAGLLAHAEVASMSTGAVTLVFPDKFTSDQTEKSRGEVEASISEALGQPTRVTFSVGGPANGTTVRTVRSEVGQQSDAAAADRKARENEARQHPRIRNAQDVFGAALKEIKT